MFRFLAQPLTRRRLVVFVLINLLATPGLGSLLARRKIAGTGQLMLALGGCGLIGAWMIQLFYRIILLAGGEGADYEVAEWLWRWGWVLFGSGWFWALLTSIGLLLQVRKLPENNNNVPPKIETQ